MWNLNPHLTEKIKRTKSHILTSIYEKAESLNLKQNIMVNLFVRLYFEMFSPPVFQRSTAFFVL